MADSRTEYKKKTTRIKAQLAEIEYQLEQHVDRIPKDLESDDPLFCVDWGHVGDLSKVVSELENIIIFLHRGY